MAFRGFTDARHEDRALNDLETRIKNSFDEISKSRILSGRLLQGVRLTSTAAQSPYPVLGSNRYLLTVSNFAHIVANTLRVQTSTTFIEGTIADGDWDGPGAGSNNACAASIATYFDSARTNISATASDATVEFLPGSGSVLQSVSVDATAGFTMGAIDATMSISSANAATFSVNEQIRLGPSSISAPSDMLPGVSRIVSKSADLGAAGINVFVDSFPSQTRGDLYVYKLIGNPIPGVRGSSKYIILNQNRPSNIWGGTSSGVLRLFCDNDCTADVWVF